MHANEPTSTPVPAPTDDTQSSADAADRRAFLKGAALVAGVAATGVLAAAPEANADRRRRHALPFGSAFGRQVRLVTLHDALDELLDRAGCRTCGLGGFDILWKSHPTIRVGARSPSKKGHSCSNSCVP